MCVCNQHAVRMRRIVICGLLRSIIFFHIISQTAPFSKNLLNTKCVFWIPLQILPEAFLILRKIERDMTKMSSGLHVKYPLILPYFHTILIFSTVYRKLLKYQISWKAVQCEPSYSMWTDRQTDMTKLTVAFRNFSNAPTNKESFGRHVCPTTYQF